MRWMKLEPIIQSKVSQKEKEKEGKGKDQIKTEQTRYISF